MPVVQALYERKLQDLGVQIVGVTQFDTTFDQAQGFIDSSGLTFENIFDSEAGIALDYNIPGVPSYVYLDRKGRIAGRTAGARGTQVIEVLLADLVAEDYQ